MTVRGRLFVTGIAALTLALPLSGCGKDKPKIPRGHARTLVALLETTERQADAKSCVTVKSTIASLQTRVANLPARTDSDVRDSLRDGIANLRSLVSAECSLEKPKPKKEDTGSTDTTDEATSDTTQETTTETTETTTDTTTDTTPTTPTTNTTPTTPPPSGGSPSDQGKSNGKGKKKGKRK